MLPWDRIAASGNTFVGYTSLIVVQSPDMGALRKYQWDRNTYLSAERAYTPLSLVAGKERFTGWDSWREKAGFDKQGTYVPGSPNGKAVFIKPNRYEQGRANIVVYNWDRTESVEIDLKDVLKPEQKYRIVSAQDFFGKPLARGK